MPDPDETKSNQSWMDTGEWAALTLGELISDMVDGGSDDSAFVRVVKHLPANESGEYIMHLEVALVPNGQVMEYAQKIGCRKFHERLIKAIQKGLVR